MKYMLEREVMVRSIKHILNKYIRECESEELLGATISHVLNCLLAPKDFIKKMDEKLLKYNLSNLNQEAEINLLQNLEKLNGPQSAAEIAEKEIVKPQVSKKEKRRQKMAAKQTASTDGSEEKTEARVSDIYEIMFSQNKDTEEFEVSEIFMEPSISLSVVRSPESPVLSMTPRQLYLEIKELAEKRYQY